MPEIRYHDPNLDAGGQFAITGETADEYNKRIQNQVEQSWEANTANIVYDSDFVTQLPYSMSVGSGTFNVNLSSEEVFMENLKASFGDEYENLIRSNAAIAAEFAATSNDVMKKLHTAELCTTELGGNHTLNCYWSFNENDDIIYPTNALDPETCELGLGRVYYEMYQSKQVVLWMTFGVPDYAGLWDFYHDAINPELSAEMHAGTSSFMSLLGRIAGGIATFSFRLATLPLYVLNQIGKLFVKYTITKYYELRITMPLYFRAVNNMMGVVAVNMGIQQGSSSNIKTDNEGAGEPESFKYDPKDLPGMMKQGLSIYSIMAKRAVYFAERNGQNKNKYTDDDLLRMMEVSGCDPAAFEDKEYAATTGSYLLGKFGESFMANSSGSTAYIGFRVEKSVDASESLSNSTGKSDLQEKLNSFKQSEANAKFNMMDMKGDDGVIGTVMKGMTDFVHGVINGIDITGLSGIVTNTGYFDIPEVWKDSSFSTSYSFNVKLVSHYCDRVSIFQNCYVPLFCLLAGALPRQVGKNTYVEPFLCRAYCKGRFAVTLGIIDSLSVKRGGDEYGWTEEGFPTMIDVSFTIKDLSPLLFMGLSGASGESSILKDLMNIFQSNNSMQEYLSTLGGLGLRERILFFPNLKRKFKAWWNVNFDTKLLNPYFWGSSIGNIPALQTSFAWMFSRLSNR